MPVERASVHAVVVEGGRGGEEAQVWVEGELELLLAKEQESAIRLVAVYTWLSAGVGGDLM